LQDLEFVVLQYAPSAIAPEDQCSSLGVILFDPKFENGAFCGVRFAADWETHLSAKYPDADIEIVSTTLRDITRGLEDKTQRSNTLAMILDSFSGTVRVIGPKACRCEDPQRELDTIASLQFPPNSPIP
jgi:hypothetical protein